MPKPTKLPRARVNPALAVRGILIDHVKADMDTHYVCAPMPSLKSARQRAKFENLSEGEKVERVMRALSSEITSRGGTNKCTYDHLAIAVLESVGAI